MPDRNHTCAPFAAFLRLPAILLAAFLLLALLPACAARATTPTAATTVPSGTTAPTPVPVSGKLRLWTTPFTAVPNPLMDNDRTHRALFRLVYQGLFRLSEEQAAVEELCRDWSLSDDGISLTVHLLAGVTFHDGSSLDSSDVLASFGAVKAAGDSSPYAYGLSNVAAVTVLDETTLRFDLVRPDAFAPHSLVFPILPSEYANHAPVSGIVPGTGPYAFVSDAVGSEVQLAKWDRFTGPGTFLVREIEAVAVTDIRGAVEAMEDDRIDLIALNADAYGVYRYRQDLSVYRYSGSDFLFFSINSEGGRSLGSADAFLLARQALDRVRVSIGTGDWTVTPAAIPSIPWSQQLGGGVRGSMDDRRPVRGVCLAGRGRPSPSFSRKRIRCAWTSRGGRSTCWRLPASVPSLSAPMPPPIPPDWPQRHTMWRYARATLSGHSGSRLAISRRFHPRCSRYGIPAETGCFCG